MCFSLGGTSPLACTDQAAKPHDGEPAGPIPVHVDERPSRLEAIRAASRQMGRARPIVAHRGSWGDEQQHQTDASGECWCGPMLIPADANPDDGEESS